MLIQLYKTKSYATFTFMTISLRRLSVVVVLALVATMFAAFPAAFAALDEQRHPGGHLQRRLWWNGLRQQQ
jgi:hypothetical protein